MSWDLFLGASFNIASTALFLEIMCRLSGLTAGKVIIQAANAHLYSSHFEALEEQLTRQLHVPPTLYLSDNIKPITDLNEIVGVFTRINPEDISLINYSSGDTIKAPMAA